MNLAKMREGDLRSVSPILIKTNPLPNIRWGYARQRAHLPRRKGKNDVRTMKFIASSRIGEGLSAVKARLNVGTRTQGVTAGSAKDVG